MVSGRDRGHQRLGPDDVHGPCQVIGQDRESHLGGYFWKRFGDVSLPCGLQGPSALRLSKRHHVAIGCPDRHPCQFELARNPVTVVRELDRQDVADELVKLRFDALELARVAILAADRVVIPFRRP